MLLKAQVYFLVSVEQLNLTTKQIIALKDSDGVVRWKVKGREHKCESALPPSSSSLNTLRALGRKCSEKALCGFCER